ncbi:hypothetical protein NVP1091O_10 [Vibrio phage 1.091.O._10N.286.52.B12]|nr:hypothetical protein NVP1091O_10 [Vibrio phage 1.091.O._10N.286.52.B12]
MPQFNLMKGSKTTANARYLDSLPVNMVPTPHETQASSGYLRSFPGITHHYDCDGLSYGAEYNDLTQTEYRILGSQLFSNGKNVADITGGKLTSVCHSANSTAFVDDGKLKYFRDDKVTELKNWYEGENYVSYPDYKFTPGFNGSGYITIPQWKNEGGFVVNVEINFKSLPSTDVFIVGAKTKYDGDTKGERFVGMFYKASDKKVYYRPNNDLDPSSPDVDSWSDNDVFVGDAVVGDNFFYAVSDTKFEFNIEYIGAVSINGTVKNKFNNGQIESLTLYDTLDGSIFRSYEMVKSVERDSDDKPSAPTTKLITNTEDETGATNGRMVSLSWAEFHTQADPVKSPATEFDLDGVIDADRHEGRYVWINDRKFGCTALTIGESGDEDTSPEQRPDYIAPFYSPESDPDDNKAIKSWQGKYVAVFGRNTTQWFGLTGNAEQIYAPQKSMQTAAGIVSTHAVCRYKDSFAAVGSIKGGTLQIMVIGPGSHQKISTTTIDSMINKYKESELQSVLVETVMMNNHDFLFIHLPKETLVFDGNQNAWFMMKSDIVGDKPYTGRHIIYNQEEGVTIGDSVANRVGKLDDSVSSQYGELTEFLLYTPLVRVNNNRGKTPLFDLQFDSVYGHVNSFQSIFISQTLDGAMYGNEYRLRYNDPLEFNNKPMISSLGAVNDSIGYKLRVVSKDPVNLSGFSVRIGYVG